MNASARTPMIVLAAGGTGGHVFPAEALAAELLRRGCRLALFTDRRGRAFGGALAAVETRRILAGGVAGKNIFMRAVGFAEMGLGLLQAWVALKSCRADVVVGFGGYPSVPTVGAALLGRVPVVLHEQNALLGRANRLFASRAACIATSFAHSRGLPKGNAGRVSFTGMPVRTSVLEKHGAPYPELNATSPIHVLVMGGSQGARILSDVVPAACALLPDDLKSRIAITQQCRTEDIERVRAQYVQTGIKADLATFFSDVPDRLAAAHLLIGRAGASTVAEASVIGRPAILVPYRYAADDHQTYNAQAVDDAGAGWLVPETAFTPQTLSERMASLFAKPAMLQKAAACAHASGKETAAVLLADQVCALLPNGCPVPQGDV